MKCPTHDPTYTFERQHRLFFPETQVQPVLLWLCTSAKWHILLVQVSALTVLPLALSLYYLFRCQHLLLVQVSALTVFPLVRLLESEWVAVHLAPIGSRDINLTSSPHRFAGFVFKPELLRCHLFQDVYPIKQLLMCIPASAQMSCVIRNGTLTQGK